MFLFDLFYLLTWDDLDLYYGHKAQEMLLTNVRGTIHVDSLTLYELNIEILLADVTKSEKSNILTLTWPVTSLVTLRSLKFVFPRQFFQGFQMPPEFLEVGRVIKKHPSGARVNMGFVFYWIFDFEGEILKK